MIHRNLITLWVLKWKKNVRVDSNLRSEYQNNIFHFYRARSSVQSLQLIIQFNLAKSKFNNLKCSIIQIFWLVLSANGIFSIQKSPPANSTFLNEDSIYRTMGSKSKKFQMTELYVS